MKVFGRWGSVNGQLEYQFKNPPKEVLHGSVFGFAASGFSFGAASGRLCLACGKSLRKTSKGRMHGKCAKNEDGGED